MLEGRARVGRSGTSGRILKKAAEQDPNVRGQRLHNVNEVLFEKDGASVSLLILLNKHIKRREDFGQVRDGEWLDRIALAVGEEAHNSQHQQVELVGTSSGDLS